MTTVMEVETKRWTAKSKAALVLEIIQPKISIVKASRTFGIPLSEIKGWVDEFKNGMENVVRA